MERNGNQELPLLDGQGAYRYEVNARKALSESTTEALQLEAAVVSCSLTPGQSNG